MPNPPDDVFPVEGTIMSIIESENMDFLEVDSSKYFIESDHLSRFAKKFQIGQKIKTFCIPDKLTNGAEVALPVSEIELVQ